MARIATAMKSSHFKIGTELSSQFNLPKAIASSPKGLRSDVLTTLSQAMISVDQMDLTSDHQPVTSRCKTTDVTISVAGISRSMPLAIPRRATEARVTV